MSSSQSPMRVRRWAVLFASMAVMLCVGTLYAFSVLRDPLVTTHGWDVADVVTVYSVNSAIGPIPMILGGVWVDRGRVKLLVLSGGLLYGVGWILSGLSTSFLMFFLAYGVVTGLGQGFAYAGCLQGTLKLFPDRRGLVSGLITAAYGAAAVFTAPLATWLITNHGVSFAMVSMGICFTIIGIAATFFIQDAPVGGYVPAGWAPPAAGQKTGAADKEDKDWKAMVRTPVFWTIFMMLVCGAFSGVMIAANALPIATSMYGLTAAAAALFVSLYAASNAGGRLVFGWLSDRAGYARTVMVIFMAVAVFLTVLVVVRGSAGGFAVGIIGLGLCFGGVMAVFPPLVMSNFGARFQGVNYGIAFTAYATSAMISPRIAATIGAGHDGDYTIAFLIAIGAAAVGLGLTLLLQRLTRRPAALAAPSLQPM